MLRLRWLSLVPLLAAATLVVGCPPRETEIVISAAGVATLVGACNNGAGALIAAETICRGLADDCRGVSCDAIDCGQLDALCDGIDLLSLTSDACGAFGDECRAQTEACPMLPGTACTQIEEGCAEATELFEDVCGVPDLDVPILSSNAELQVGVQVVLTTGLGGDKLTESDCGVRDVAAENFADGLNEAIGDAIGADGLQHETVDEPEDALPIMLLFHDRDGEGVSCKPRELFACAALGRRSTGDENFDVLCGSCQKGFRPTLPTPPCDEECMLPFCLSLLGVTP